MGPLVKLAPLLLFVVSTQAGNKTATGRNSRELLRQAEFPFLEVYWESYLSWPYSYDTCAVGVSDFDVDESAYAYDLGLIPVGQNGAQVVNIAFAYSEYILSTTCRPFIDGLHLFEDIADDGIRFIELQDDIALLQAQGALVKLAYGGQQWGNTGVFTDWWADEFDVDYLVSRIVQDVTDLNLDGVDLTQEGVSYSSAFSSYTSLHLMILQKLRAALPDKIISYTFPLQPSAVLFRDVTTYGHPYVDYFNVYRGDQADMDLMVSYGVPREKIVWGADLRCSTDSGDDPYGGTRISSYDDAINLATSVRVGGYAGASLWSINKDTDHRPGESGCTTLQTGLSDGSIVFVMHQEL